MATFLRPRLTDDARERTRFIKEIYGGYVEHRSAQWPKYSFSEAGGPQRRDLMLACEKGA
jgi:hypothetical protein